MEVRGIGRSGRALRQRGGPYYNISWIGQGFDILGGNGKTSPRVGTWRQKVKGAQGVKMIPEKA